MEQEGAELAAAAAARRKPRLVFTEKLMTGQTVWIIVLANDSLRTIYILKRKYASPNKFSWQR